MFFYSPSKDSCYPGDLLDDYINGSGLPDDLIEIPFDAFKEYFLENTSHGKKRIFNNGSFSLQDTGPSYGEMIRDEEYWIASELEKATLELEKVQDSDPSATGTVSQWRTYRKELRAWPSNPKFPDKNFRPKSQL